MFCTYRDGIDNSRKTGVVTYRQAKLVALGHDTSGIDGRYHDITRQAILAIVACSDGTPIGGEEVGQHYSPFVKLGSGAVGGVSHQHEEYAPVERRHGA